MVQAARGGLPGDRRDPAGCRGAVRGRPSSSTCARPHAIPYSYPPPTPTADHIGGALNLLNACRDRVERLLHSSTCEVYGTALRLPIDEATPSGQSPYSASKIGAVMLAESYHRAFGVRWPSCALQHLRPRQIAGGGSQHLAQLSPEPRISAWGHSPHPRLQLRGRTARGFVLLGHARGRWGGCPTWPAAGGVSIGEWPGLGVTAGKPASSARRSGCAPRTARWSGFGDAAGQGSHGLRPRIPWRRGCAHRPVGRRNLDGSAGGVRI